MLLTYVLAGLVFLLQHPDLSSTIIHAFKGDDDVNDFIPLRYASVLISKGFFCRLRDIGINLEMHLRVVSVHIGLFFHQSVLAYPFLVLPPDVFL